MYMYTCVCTCSAEIIIQTLLLVYYTCIYTCTCIHVYVDVVLR